MKNKKADERVLSIYLFIIYVIVAIGIVSGVLLFYGSGLDIRKVEASVLSDKVIDCLVEQGRLRENVFGKGFDLLGFCGFDFKDNSGDSGDSGEEEYAVSVGLFDFDSGEELGEELVFGREDFLKYCGLKGDRIPKCDEKQVYVLSSDIKIESFTTGSPAEPGSVGSGELEGKEGGIEEIQSKVLLKVKSAVRKIEKNV